MNERIEKLASKAGFNFWGGEHWKPQGAVIDWSCNYDNELENFAQLIAVHCISLIRESMSDSERSDLVYNAMLVDVISKINNEFFKHKDTSKREKFAAAFEDAFKDGVDLSGRDTP